jgi:hypothetical protein
MIVTIFRKRAECSAPGSLAIIICVVPYRFLQNIPHMLNTIYSTLAAVCNKTDNDGWQNSWWGGCRQICRLGEDNVVFQLTSYGNKDKKLMECDARCGIGAIAEFVYQL